MDIEWLIEMARRLEPRYGESTETKKVGGHQGHLHRLSQLGEPAFLLLLSPVSICSTGSAVNANTGYYCHSWDFDGDASGVTSYSQHGFSVSPCSLSY